MCSVIHNGIKKGCPALSLSRLSVARFLIAPKKTFQWSNTLSFFSFPLFRNVCLWMVQTAVCRGILQAVWLGWDHSIWSQLFALSVSHFRVLKAEKSPCPIQQHHEIQLHSRAWAAVQGGKESNLIWWFENVSLNFFPFFPLKWRPHRVYLSANQLWKKEKSTFSQVILSSFSSKNRKFFRWYAFGWRYFYLTIRTG